jgi:hypothetical protein
MQLAQLLRLLMNGYTNFFGKPNPVSMKVLHILKSRGVHFVSHKQ